MLSTQPLSPDNIDIVDSTMDSPLEVATTTKLEAIPESTPGENDQPKPSKPRKFVVRRYRRSLAKAPTPDHADDSKLVQLVDRKGIALEVDAEPTKTTENPVDEPKWKVVSAAEWDPANYDLLRQGAVHPGLTRKDLVRKDAAHHDLVRKDQVHHGLIRKDLVPEDYDPKQRNQNDPANHGLVRKDAVPKDYNHKSRIHIHQDHVQHGLMRKDIVRNDSAHPGLVRKDAVHHGLARKDQVPKDYDPKDHLQKAQAREVLVRKDAAHNCLVRKDAVPEDRVRYGLIRKDQVPKEYHHKKRAQQDITREELLREYRARKDLAKDAARKDAAHRDHVRQHAVYAGSSRSHKYPAQTNQDAVHDHIHPAVRQIARHEQTTHEQQHVAHAGPSQAKPTRDAPRQSTQEPPRASTSDHSHRTASTRSYHNPSRQHQELTSNDHVEEAEISALDLIDSYGDQLDPMSFTDDQWDEILEYQVRYVRRQRREKRRLSMGVNLRDVFARVDPTSKGGPKDASKGVSK